MKNELLKEIVFKSIQEVIEAIAVAAEALSQVFGMLTTVGPTVEFFASMTNIP